jgi:putative component of membrane protein insertase Oxa1/YidC/SpoIIIJ protein YidD
MLKALALAAIAFYQRYLSPRKGYSCAFRVHTGRDSCSAYGKRVIERYGAPYGVQLIKRRLKACSRTHHAQAGFVDCDLPCEGPDISACEDMQAALDAAECCGYGCDPWPSPRKKEKLAVDKRLLKKKKEEPKL